MTPDNERPNPWVDPVYDTSTPRPNLHSGIGEEGLRRAAMALFEPMDHGSPSKPNAGHTVEAHCRACVNVRAKRTQAIHRALVQLGDMPAVGFRATADKDTVSREDGERYRRIDAVLDSMEAREAAATPTTPALDVDTMLAALYLTKPKDQTRALWRRLRAETVIRRYIAALSPTTDTPKRKRIDWSNVVVDEGDEAP